VAQHRGVSQGQLEQLLLGWVHMGGVHTIQKHGAVVAAVGMLLRDVVEAHCVCLCVCEGGCVVLLVVLVGGVREHFTTSGRGSAWPVCSLWRVSCAAFSHASSPCF